MLQLCLKACKNDDVVRSLTISRLMALIVRQVNKQIYTLILVAGPIFDKKTSCEIYIDVGKWMHRSFLMNLRQFR